MVCSQCGQFFLNIVPTRCACGGNLRAATANQPRTTADLIPLGTHLQQRPSWEAFPGYDEPTLGVGWMTPSLAGDTQTQPASPYAPSSDLTPPPPPAGLVAWHKTPPPHKLAQMSFVLLSAGILFWVTGSTQVGSGHPLAASSAHTQTLTEMRQSTAQPTSPGKQPAPPAPAVPPDVTFTVQLPRPTSPEAQTTDESATDQGDQQNHQGQDQQKDYRQAGPGNIAPLHHHKTPSNGPHGKDHHHHG